jgi:hypothetical protein
MWSQFPGVDDLSGPALSTFAVAMARDSSVDDDSSITAAAFDGIIQYIARWPIERRTAISALIPAPHPTMTNNSPVSSFLVFCCKRTFSYHETSTGKHPFMIGLDEAVAHRHRVEFGFGLPAMLYPQRWKDSSAPIIEYSKRGTEALAAILACSRSSTLEALTKLDARYVCMACEPKMVSGNPCRRAMQWRQCVRILSKMTLIN